MSGLYTPAGIVNKGAIMDYVAIASIVVPIILVVMLIAMVWDVTNEEKKK